MRWSKADANAWYDKQPWLVGCNFIPSTAVNQLEMWQEESFDVDTITRELGWAADLGFNTLRVYLHDLVWQEDPEGFKGRIDQFLDLTSRNNICPMLVFFDDCWRNDPQLGKQPDPVWGQHNSGWVQSPGDSVSRDPSQWGRLEDYVKDILSTYGSDDRVLLWDLYNEPGNTFFQLRDVGMPWKLFKFLHMLFSERFIPTQALPLLRETFKWAREVKPAQPLTAGVYFWNRALNKFLLEESDVISFHNYLNVAKLTKQLKDLKKQGRPLFCTEYMARTSGSCFDTHLPIFKQEKIACYNWGFVSGKTQTIYPWLKDGQPGVEPPLWFHDIFRQDGTPFRQEEVEIIRRLTGKQ